MNTGISRRVRRLVAMRKQQGIHQFFVAPKNGVWHEGVTGIEGETKEKCLARLSEYIDRKGIEDSITYIDDLTEDLELLARE